jgi:hypothetical protein
MSQQIKTTQKIILQRRTKKLTGLKKDLKKVQIVTAQDQNGSLIRSINARYNHSNQKSAIPLVNINGGQSFNHNQIQTIKKYLGEYDNKLGYWFISI